MKQSGEISAIGGFYTQYTIAAWEIYSAISNNSLEWIELASSDAGILDDVLIGINNRVLACQVKDRSDIFSFNSLMNLESGVLKKMYDSWLNLKIKYREKNIDVRFITTQSMSENDSIKSYSGKEKPNFSQFYKNFLNKIKSGKNYGANWNTVLDEIMTLLNCSKDSVIEFIKATHFSFNHEVPDEKDFNALKWVKINDDIGKIRHFIFDALGKQKKVLKLSYSEFIEEIGFKRRLETYFQHDFFVDELHYQPIAETIEKLNKLTNVYSSGYIGLSGSAGSGKSTLLTRWLQESNDHILKYYAYVNRDMTYDSGFRGESKYFLHDIITQIKLELGFQDLIPSSNRIDLTVQLGNELKRFSKDFLESGVKTYIIIDGLDHIEREQKVEYSLLKDLPDPESIPPGVYFILGSRNIENLLELGVKIRHSLKNDSRIIEIDSLSKSELLNVVKSYTPINLEESQVNQLYSNTLGHPLFLRYKIEKLIFSPLEEYDTIINDQQFTGDINDEYERFWMSIQDDTEFRNLLGIICRFRFSFFEIDFLENDFKFAEANLLKLFSVRYFFNIPEPGKWQYFHNSFKWFLEKATATSILSGAFSEAKDEQYHLEIANNISSVKSNYRWNLIYHLFKSRQFSKILEIGTQDYFRDQWYGFRNSMLINEDIGIALKASYYQKELKCLVRYFYSASELRQRIAVFDPSSCYDIYVELGMRDIADSYIFEGKNLLVSKRRGLSYTLTLIENQELDIAQKMFELSEPNFILKHSKEIDRDRIMPGTFDRVDEAELVEKWALVALNYYNLNEITALLENLTVVENDDRYGNKQPQQTQAGMNLRLIYDCVSAIINYATESNDFHLVLNSLQYLKTRIVKHKLMVDLFYHVLVACGKKYQPLYSFLKQSIDEYGVGDSDRVNYQLALSHLYYFDNKEKAEVFFDKLANPLSKSEEDFNKYNRINNLFDYSRLYFSLHQKNVSDLQELVSLDGNKDEKVLYNFVVSISYHYSLLFRFGNIATSDISILLKNLLVFYHKNFLELDHTVQELKCHIIGLIINLVQNETEQVSNSILEIISNDWRQFKKYWKSYDIRSIIRELKSDKKSVTWCVSELTYLETVMLSSQSPEERCEHCIEQARDWLQFGNKEKARKNMHNALRQTLGLGREKDYQFDYLLKWMPVIRKFEEGKTKERLHWLLQRMHSIQDVSSSDCRSAADSLLKECLEWNIDNGFGLAKWFLLNRMMDFSKFVEGILEFCVVNDKSNIPVYSKLFTRILLFFQDNNSYGHDIIPRLIEESGTAENVSSIIDEVLIYGIEEKKNKVLHNIIESSDKNAISITIKKEDFPLDDRNSSSDHGSMLELKDGERFERDELIKRIKSFEELVDLLQKESGNSYFKWSKLIKNLKFKFSETQINELIDKGDFDAIELSEIANYAFESGFVKLAREISYLALGKSKSTGWIKHYDGGSKILPFKMLSRVEKQEIVTDLIFKDLVFSFKEINIKELSDDILELLELLIPQDSPIYRDIYFEVEDYIKALLSNTEINQEAFLLNEQGSTFKDLVANFILFLYEFPVSGIKEHIESILIESFEQSSELVTSFLDVAYERKYYLSYLNILNGIVRHSVQLSDPIINNIKGLINFERFDIVSAASELLDILGISNELKSSGQSLPLVYEMQFESKPELIIDKDVMLERLEKRRGLRETKDPIEFIGYYRRDATFLSEESGIPEINIAHRIMQLTNEAKLPNWFNDFSEEEIVSLFKAIDFNMPYIRPRMMKLWWALMQVLYELWNANMISLSTALFISKDSDPAISNVKPNVKPSFVNPLTWKDNDKPARRSHLGEEWVNKMGDECFNNIKLLTEEHQIVAEFTKIVSLDHGRPKEVRNSFISLKESIKVEKHIFYESNVVNCYIEEYFQQNRRELIFFNYGNTFDNRRQWLAINPGLCFSAGWLPSDDGLFRWVDYSGETMVESIFWMDGNTSNYERLFDSQCSYGWVVLMKQEALDIIKEMFDSPLYFHRKCERKYRLIQERYATDIDASKSLVDTIKI